MTARRRAALALSMGVAAAAGTSALGAQLLTPPAPAVALADSAAVASTPALSALERAAFDDRVSRSMARAEAPDAEQAAAEEDEPEVIGKRYATVPLNVRTAPDTDSDVVAVLDVGARVRITDEKDDSWRQILHKGELRWVKASYLSKDKPPTGPSTAPCDSGSAVERGLVQNAIDVHRAVCGRYPQITSYGGIRSGSTNHATGRALDIMVRGSVGDDVARWLRENASELGVTEIIWEQRIWTVQRSGDGWRWMADRGSDTTNHYDHVHVSVR